MNFEGENSFDVIVVGGGHAGCEAALASARMGARTLMVVQDLDHLAYMPCNPSIGGPAKGHLVREISALGGEQARAADSSGLMMRWLNTSKGPAVRALRSQNDLWDYHSHYLKALMDCPNLRIFQDTAERLLIRQGRVAGIRSRYELEFWAPRVILATGTHLGGRIHVGLVNFQSGPLGQMATQGLSQDLRDLGLAMQRLKTGTTPRIHRDSIDWDVLELQEGEREPVCFDLWGTPRVYREIRCGLSRTNAETHRIVQQGLERSPIVQGQIEGTGPRYCPSIESKVMAFPEKDSHPIFLEPVARGSVEIYVQNFSTSLPVDVQIAMTRTLPGCSRAVLLRPGYAIEYDAIDPVQLTPWLELQALPGLYCAGQINGTSGYEEAAVQGLLAGVNAVLTLRGQGPVILGRHEAYAGVLIDDLVTKGTKEPYRMLTSRCEHRLLLRHDNAGRRLAPLGRRLGLVSEDQWRALNEGWEAVDREVERLGKIHFSPQKLQQSLKVPGFSAPDRGLSAQDLLRRPEVTYKDLKDLLPPPALEGALAQEAEITVKYQGYVDRQNRAVEKMLRLESLKIPTGFDYRGLKSLSAESREKLEQVRPLTLGQAGRISGVTPADLQYLAVLIQSRRR